MDPTLNYLPTVDEVPASVLDVHRAVVKGSGSRVGFQRDGATTHPAPEGRPLSRKARTIDYFHSFAVVNRNDFLSRRSKFDDYTLVVWEEGVGRLRPTAPERRRAWLRGGAALLAAVGAASALLPYLRPPRPRP